MGSTALDHRAARVEAYHAIQRVMSLHCYLTAAGRTDELIGLFTQHRPEVSAELADWGVFVGLDRVRQTAVDPLDGMARHNGAGVRLSKPHITDDRAGLLMENAIMTPLIEVNHDATEARGLWMVHGASAGFDPGAGQVTPMWAWVTFEVEFALEDGEWRILHFRVAPRFRTAFNRSWAETAADGPMKPPPGLVPEPDLPSTSDVPTDYALDRAPAYDPKVPQAYPKADDGPVDADDADLDRRLSRLEDAIAIANLMSAHEYLHVANRNGEEFERFFAAKQPDVSFEPESWGVWEGSDAIHASYVVGAPPEIPGLVTEHATTTPVIEIAADGLTAKGVWMSPGHETFPNFAAGGFVAHWSWGRYGVDFIKEDGEWKFWHFHIYTTFRTPYGVSWVDAALDPSHRLFPEGEMPPGMPQPTRAGTFNQEYHPDLTPAYQPVPPAPYATWADTFSYTPKA